MSKSQTIILFITEVKYISTVSCCS